MTVKNTYIVSHKSHWQVLYELESGHYFMTTNGGFGQLEYHLEQIDDEEAIEILKANNYKQDKVFFRRSLEFDGCLNCKYNKPSLKAGYWCLNNCINGSKFQANTNPLN